MLPHGRRCHRVVCHHQPYDDRTFSGIETFNTWVHCNQVDRMHIFQILTVTFDTLGGSGSWHPNQCCSSRGLLLYTTWAQTFAMGKHSAINNFPSLSARSISVVKHDILSISLGALYQLSMATWQ
jgi:hypothetical protein